MKLTIKTLQQSNFKIDIEPDKTVKELKELIERDHGKEYPSSSQKLIYNGKILTDETPLDEYKIDEKKFIVLMITRPPPVTKPSNIKENTQVKKEKSSGASAGASESKEDKTKATSSSAESTSSRSSVPNTTVATNAPSTVAASANNTTTTASSNERTASIRNTTGSILDALPLSDPSIASLISSPHFRQMQDVIQQTPQLLSSRIEELSTTNPEMYKFISENPDAFVNMLNHPPVGGRNVNEGAGSGADDLLQSYGLGRGPGADQNAPAEISPHDVLAIERLKELGFPEHLAVQAYMACDKDEQLAANLLLQMDGF